MCALLATTLTAYTDPLHPLTCMPANSATGWSWASSKNMRPKTKFLTVVWGKAYIARFASLALPSFLAEGNLPALARSTELEVVIMTRRDDIDFFEKHATFRTLQEICPVRFVEIDDLITTAVYGVTLTLAYARPIIACGSEMVNIHFVFMNADFVLADGSLRSLGEHILAGRSIVLGPSFRSTAEAVEPFLEAAVNQSSGVLTIPPRQLTALSLAHPHPTTIAKTLNQDFCHSVQANQFFWRVDAQTMLGRYYLIFMLALKPERVISTINSYCDYALIPELCPSGDEVVMGDSDHFFMLELQQREQEMGLLHLGRQRDAEIASSLQYWTTAEHRRAASHDIVFHAADIPPEIEAAKAQARAFVGNIQKKLRRPMSHEGHRYWVRGVEAWRNYRMEQGLTASPPELAPLKDGPLKWLWAFLYFGRRTLHAMKMTPLHPYWLDYRLLRETISTLLAAPNASVLIVREKANLVDSLVGINTSVQFVTPQEVLKNGPPTPRHGSGGYTHALLHLLRKDCRSAQEIIKQCQPAMAPRSTCTVFIHHWLGETENSNFSRELVHYVEDILGESSPKAACTYVGGRLKRGLMKEFGRLSRHYRRFGIVAFLWIVPLMALAVPLALIANFYLALTQPSRHYLVHCSSAAIHLETEPN